MRSLSAKSKVFIALVVASGLAVLGFAVFSWKVANWTEFLMLLAVALLASRLHVRMPGVTGTLSVNLPFILLAAAEMGSAEAVIIGCLSTLVQCLPRAQQKFIWIQGLFNFANMALAVGATRLLYHAAALQSAIHSPVLLLAVAAAGFYVVNSVPVSIIIGLTEKRSALRSWTAMVQLSYPYYLASAGIACVVMTASPHIGWQVPLMVLPLMAGVFYSHRRYFSPSAIEQEGLKRSPQSVKVAQAVS